MKLSMFSKCELCNTERASVKHHIIMRHKIVNRFYHAVKNSFHLETEIINHPRNLISLCKTCHAKVHADGLNTTDIHLTKVFKAIKRFSF
jgi:hypothetical protein